jgi:hypothetical protein
VFLIEFTIPKDSGIGEYDAVLSVASNNTIDKKTMKLKIYSSVDSLLRSQIDELNVDLEKLKTEIEVAKRSGKDVSDLELFIEETEIQIRLAEQNLANKKYDETVKHISNARNLIERTRDLLYEKVLARERPSIFLYIIPIVLVLIILVLVVFFILYKRKKEKKPIFPALERIKGALTIPKVENRELLEEKERLERMLKLLEREKKEKIISKSVYNEMKNNVEKKIKEIDKKLK